MLFLALAFAGVTAGPAPDPQRAKRVRVVRVPARAKPGNVRIPVRTVARDPNDRYRLTGLPSGRIDGKDLAVRDRGMACGTTGAPVCPSKGAALFKSDLDD